MVSPEYLVGRMGCKYKELLNTYYITKDEKLIPCPLKFYGDSCGPIQGIIGNMEKYVFESLSEEALSIVPDLFTESKQVIDEILAIADHENSFGLVKRNFTGFYLPDSKDFFNTEILRNLYQRIEEIETDFKQGKDFFDKVDELSEYWLQNLQKKESDYFAKLLREQQDYSPLPRGLEELGVDTSKHIKFWL